MSVQGAVLQRRVVRLSAATLPISRSVAALLPLPEPHLAGPGDAPVRNLVESFAKITPKLVGLLQPMQVAKHTRHIARNSPIDVKTKIPKTLKNSVSKILKNAVRQKRIGKKPAIIPRKCVIRHRIVNGQTIPVSAVFMMGFTLRPFREERESHQPEEHTRPRRPEVGHLRLPSQPGHIPPMKIRQQPAPEAVATGLVQAVSVRQVETPQQVALLLQGPLVLQSLRLHHQPKLSKLSRPLALTLRRQPRVNLRLQAQERLTRPEYKGYQQPKVSSRVFGTSSLAAKAAIL